MHYGVTSGLAIADEAVCSKPALGSAEEAAALAVGCAVSAPWNVLEPFLLHAWRTADADVVCYVERKMCLVTGGVAGWSGISASRKRSTSRVRSASLRGPGGQARAAVTRAAGPPRSVQEEPNGF